MLNGQSQRFVDQNKLTAGRSRNKMKKTELDSADTLKTSSQPDETRRDMKSKGKRKNGLPRNIWRRDMKGKMKKVAYIWKEFVNTAQSRQG